MLGLLAPTDPAWVDIAANDLESLLSDHAHCELKAAQMALSLVARYGGEIPELVDPLVELAREEATHFHQVHERLQKQGAPLSMPGSDAYVRALQKATRVDHTKVPALLDKLLVSALIEARSAERFKLLSEHLPDEEDRKFYRELLASEARHYRLFAGMAEKLFGVDQARARLRELAEREASIVSRLPNVATVHG
jgi:tRNA-(ms[2]io[6]A)-hydroxylase